MIDLGRIKGWNDFGTTQWFWTRDPWKSSAFTTTVHSIISIQEEGDANVLILKKGIESSLKVTRCKRKITSRNVGRTMLSTCRKIDLKCVPVRRDCKGLSGNNPQLEIRSFDESDEEFSSVFWHFRNYLISSKTVSVYLPLRVLKSCYVVIFSRDIAETLIISFFNLFVIISLQKKNESTENSGIFALWLFGILPITTCLCKKKFPRDTWWRLEVC